jgi:hypothetical protein
VLVSTLPAAAAALGLKSAAVLLLVVGVLVCHGSGFAAVLLLSASVSSSGASQLV